jgi:hypothetical protein
MLPQRRFAIRALRVDSASHPAVADAAFARYAARLAAQPGRNEHRIPPNRSGIKIPVPATVFVSCYAPPPTAIPWERRLWKHVEVLKGMPSHGPVELPPHISLAIYEGPDTEQPRIVAEHVLGNQSEISLIFNRLRNFDTKRSVGNL